ncbi:MAG: restriction endonuclease subunit S [Chitinophagales bacterium]|nr:restriction endonuclease subunit S [Chitinophagales bacterium]
MKTLIRDISNIQTGIFAQPDGKGELAYLQSKHFDEYGHLHSALFPDLPAEGIAEKHLLKDGDVLFAAKGTKNFAAVFENLGYPAVASTTFFIIRINNPQKILPHFLAWYLNSQYALNRLKARAKGTSLPSISKNDVEELEIPVPEIKTQKAIVAFSTLRNREKSLKQKIEFLREKQIQQQIINAIK